MPKKNNFEIPHSIISTGKLLQVFSKKLASNFVLKLFITPPRFKTPEREEMMRKSAKNVLVEIPSINKEVNVYEYGFSRKKILLVHGWAGRGTQLYEIADKLLENGMMVVSFDLPAHGLSSSKTTNLLECISVIEHLNEKYGPFETAIGHSFGGIALLGATAKKSFLSNLVVIGVESSNNKFLDTFVNKLKLKPKISELTKAQIRTKFRTDLESLAAGASARKVSIPTLVVHDIEDYDADVSSAYKIRQNLNKGKLLITSGLGHRRILKDHDTIDKIIAFIKN